MPDKPVLTVADDPQSVNRHVMIAMQNSLYPGASVESIKLVLSYCKARDLDPMKKPVHIVPLRYKDGDGKWKTKDVIMPGIYEFRTTAQKTGQYLGQDEPEFGPEISYLNVTAPEWAKTCGTTPLCG